MSNSKIKNYSGSPRRAFARLCSAATLVCAAGIASAAVPGITGTTFNLQANQGYNTQPDGVQIYSWGYGCGANFTPTFSPASFATAGVVQFCPAMQMPGPTLIVTEGQIVTVTLTNNLPPAAGKTSIVFPGFTPS